MKKIFKHIKIKSKALNIIVSAMRVFKLESRSKKASTFLKEYLTMPMSFDFTAYYDDDEVLNNNGVVSPDTPTVEQIKSSSCNNTSWNGSELQASAQCPPIGCCIN